MKLHGNSYKPLWPHTTIVDARGAITIRTRYTFWLFWVWEKELPITETA